MFSRVISDHRGIEMKDGENPGLVLGNCGKGGNGRDLEKGKGF